MLSPDFITIKEICELLSISRPTFYKYKEEYSLKETKARGKVYFSKLEILEKILYSIPLADAKRIKIHALDSQTPLRALFLTQDIIDLRGEIALDAFAITSLLCKLKALIKNENKNVYLLVENNGFCQYLKKLGFFTELERSNSDQVFVDKSKISDDKNALKGSVILPLNILGYRGAEKKVLEELYDALMAQGFSEQLSAYLGWVVGELSDNCHTHSKGGPCYLMIESKISKDIEFKFLSMVIGDVGIGIQSSLRSNPKHSHLNDPQALLSAFLSEVSSWPDEAKRGKGLNDILGIAKGNEAWLRCESSNFCFFADFNVEDKIEFEEPITDSKGTRIGLILIDNKFKKVSRADMNIVLQKKLGTI